MGDSIGVRLSKTMMQGRKGDVFSHEIGLGLLVMGSLLMLGGLTTAKKHPAKGSFS